MDEEREQPRGGGEFRVVDKRISARSDAPRDTPDTGSPTAPEAPAPSPPPPSAPPPPPPETTEPGPDRPARPETEAAAAGESIWTPEQEAEARAFVEEMAQRPSLEWVVNTAVTLANVAGTKLDLGRTADAQLAIDALAALVEKLGSRLDQAEAPLRQTLAQLQLAYAQRAAQPPAAGAPPAPG